MEFLRRVYDLASQEETDAYYTAWADSYDAELEGQGYRTPARCAAALARFVPHDAAILDIGCGTGLSGRAFAAAGFTTIDGTDVNAAMLERAERSGVYATTWVTDPDDPMPFAPGRYDALAAVGVIGVGAAPASLLGDALAALPPGGHLVFSYNEHARDLPEYADALVQAQRDGNAELRLAEDGIHIEGLGTRSDVYVLQRR